MGFLDRIAECNNADLTRFRPFLIGAEQAGWVHTEFLPVLRRFPGVFLVGDKAVSLAPALDAADKRSKAVDAALRQLAAEGHVRGWREEIYPVRPLAGGPVLMAMERAAVPHLGVRAHGVHLNGFVRRADGIHMWIARRAQDKPTYPGMLDNMVAGGQPLGLGYRENLIKECAEEAAVPRALAERAVAVGAISYAYVDLDEGGLRPDIQVCFDLELPPDFTPSNADGEIAEFMLWPIQEVARIVSDTRQFKFNCNLCIIDFLVRHGLIEPEHPDYQAICRGLRR
jgi:isopentenyldiphosphate isomerase